MPSNCRPSYQASQRVLWLCLYAVITYSHHCCLVYSSPNLILILLPYTRVDLVRVCQKLYNNNMVLSCLIYLWRLCCLCYEFLFQFLSVFTTSFVASVIQCSKQLSMHMLCLLDVSVWRTAESSVYSIHFVFPTAPQGSRHHRLLSQVYCWRYRCWRCLLICTDGCTETWKSAGAHVASDNVNSSLSLIELRYQNFCMEYEHCYLTGINFCRSRNLTGFRSPNWMSICSC